MSCSWLGTPIDFLRSLLHFHSRCCAVVLHCLAPPPQILRTTCPYLDASQLHHLLILLSLEFRIVLHSVTCRKHGALCSNQYTLLSCFSYPHSHISTHTSMCITVITLLLSDKDNAPWKLLIFCIPGWGKKKVLPTYYTASGCPIVEFEELLRQVADSNPSDQSSYINTTVWVHSCLSHNSHPSTSIFSLTSLLIIPYNSHIPFLSVKNTITIINKTITKNPASTFKPL